MPNFATSTYQAALFKSVIPSDIAWSPPMSGIGSPQGRLRGVPGQLYTQLDAGPQLWCKGTTAPDTGWFQVAANAGHPHIIIGNTNQYDPSGVVITPGPAVWYGGDKSIWVKTDSANDANNWHLLLEYSLSSGVGTYSGGTNQSNEELES